MFPFLSKLFGADALKTVGSGVSNVLDRFLPKKMSQREWTDYWLEKAKMETNDAMSARMMDMAMSIHQQQPWLVRLLKGLVTPYGGIGALTIFFFNILAPNLAKWTGYPFSRTELTPGEELILGGIIAFFFGYRYYSKKAGVSGKE